MAKPDPHNTHKHPPYLAVFGWLTGLTAVEVFPIMTEIFFGIEVVPYNYFIPVLILIALLKATLVAMYYMHLKYDPPWLSVIFVAPYFFAMFFGLTALYLGDVIR
jgi:cytochrome c oxidase subunit 4